MQCLLNGKLLAKLSAGDMMAQDAKCHPLCLASFYKRTKSLDDCKEDGSDRINHREGWVVPCGLDIILFVLFGHRQSD